MLGGCGGLATRWRESKAKIGKAKTKNASLRDEVWLCSLMICSDGSGLQTVALDVLSQDFGATQVKVAET